MRFGMGSSTTGSGSGSCASSGSLPENSTDLPTLSSFFSSVVVVVNPPQVFSAGSSLVLVPHALVVVSPQAPDPHPEPNPNPDVPDPKSIVRTSSFFGAGSFQDNPPRMLLSSLDSDSSRERASGFAGSFFYIIAMMIPLVHTWPNSKFRNGC